MPPQALGITAAQKRRRGRFEPEPCNLFLGQPAPQAHGDQRRVGGREQVGEPLLGRTGRLAALEDEPADEVLVVDIRLLQYPEPQSECSELQQRSLDDSVETLGSSMILISHDLAVVSALCERVYVMFRGRIVESGTTEQIFEHPQHEYTQELIKSVLSFTDDSPRLYVSQYGNR